MKRKTKIITLIILLTLLLAALVVVASAEGEDHGLQQLWIAGKEIMLYGTDESASFGSYVNTNDNTPTIKIKTGGWGYVRISIWNEDTNVEYLKDHYSDNSGISTKDVITVSPALPDGDYGIWIGGFNGNRRYTEQWGRFTIDTSAPTGQLKGVSNNGRTGGNVTFSWEEKGCTATLNGGNYTNKDYKSGTTISGDANTNSTFKIVLTDKAGNITNYSFVIDKLAPTGTLSGVTNGGTTGSNVSFTWSQYDDCTATLSVNGGTPQNYSKNSAISGVSNAITNYTIVLTDTCKNSSTYTFTIDKVAPVGTLSGVSPGGTTGGSVSFAWEESGATATLSVDGSTSNYTNGASISGVANAVKTYTIVLKDIYGNQSSYTFTINKKEPILNLYDSSQTLKTDGFITNKDVYFTWSDSTEAGACSVRYKKDNGQWVTGYLQFYYYNSENPSVKYATSDAARAAIATAEQGKITAISAWNGTGTVYSADTSIAIVGSPCWQYKDYIFFSETNLNEYKASIVNSLCKSSNKNLITEEGSYTVQIIGYYGTTVTKYFTIDKTAPTGSLTTTQEGGFAYAQGNTYRTNGTVTFAWTEATASATLNNEVKTSSFSISGVENANTEYIITLTDVAGNTTQYTVLINKALPTGTLTANGKTLVNGGITNGNVKLTYNTTLYTAKLNNKIYTSGTEISAEGSNSIILSDSTGNSTVYTFEIDKTAPVGELIDVENGGTTGGSVSFSWSEAGASATLNGNTYIVGASIVGIDNTVTNYEIILTDRAGNSTIYSFYIDKKAPTGKLTGVKDGDITNGLVIFSWQEEDCTATLNGESYTSGTEISEEGIYNIHLEDAYGNYTEYTFEIDKTAPVGELVGVVNGGATKQEVTLIWRDETYAVYMNGVEIIGNLQPDGSLSYTFIPEEEATLNVKLKIEDIAGNFSEYSFTLDTEAPSGSLSDVFNSSNKTNKDVYFTWSERTEGICTATLNGNHYENGAKISGEGSYSLILTDLAGNESSYTFEIDKTAPVGELVGVANGGITNGTVKFKWSENGCTATLGKEAYTKNAEISAEGFYTITLCDDVNNTTTYTFTIDKTAPVGELVGVANGGITKDDVYFTWDEEGCTATLDGEAYSKGTNIVSEGMHSLILTDRAGNSTVYTFEIDRTAPVGELIGAENGGATKGSVSFTWSGDYYSATLNGSEYVKGNIITAEGAYELKLYDEVGNVGIYTFEIDRTAPTGTLTGVANGGVTKNNVTFKWSESGCTATLNGELYSKSASIENERIHTIVLTDKAGNSTVYTFEIDRTAPSVTFSQEGNSLSNVLYFKDNFSASWSEAGASATLNGNNYISGDLISDEASYELIVTDGAGNTTTYSIVLDKTSYTANKDYFSSQGKSNPAKWYETYYYTFASNNYNFGGQYSFSNYSDALKYATARETSIVEKHDAFTGNTIICNWANRAVDSYDVLSSSDMLNNAYSIYFDIDDRSKLKAYFNEANLIAAINFYAQQSISEKYIPSSPAQAFPGGLDVAPQDISRDAIYIKASSINWRNKPAGVTLYVDGYVSSYDVALTVGYHKIREIDAAGNVCEYNIVIDNAAPSLITLDAAGNRLTGENNPFRSNPAYASQIISIIPDDTFDKNSLMIITLNGTETYFISDGNNKYTFSSSGAYEIEIYDVAGNKATYSLYVSLEAPTITDSDVISSKGTFLGKNIVIDKGLSFNKILTLAIMKYNADATLWESLASDSSSKEISIDNLSYYIAESGLFNIILTDNFGRTVEKQIEIYKDAPVGKIFSADGFEISSGTHTQKNVYFTWEDDSCTAYIISGDSTLEYTKKSYITAEGTYTIKLVDLSNSSSIYTFKIDRTAPKASLYKSEGNSVFTEISNGNYSNKPIKLTWDTTLESQTTASFSKNGSDYLPYANGTVITEDGSYVIKLTDGAGNSRSYTFEIDRTVVSVSIIDQDGNVLKNGALTNKTFYFDWSESGCAATLGGRSYTAKTAITSSGVYSFYIEDKFGNYTYLTVTVDKVAPVGELVGAENGGITNGGVIFSWSENGCTATLNNEPFSSGSEINAEGVYELKLYDAAGNSTVYTFEIDKTAPVGELVGVANGGITSGSVYFNWKEIGATAILNGEDYTRKTYLTEEKAYTLILTDLAGNESSYTFEIDKTAPVGELVGAENGSFTNSNVYFVWHESGCTATLNGISYNSGSEIANEGTYTIKLSDRAGNSTVYTFEVDKTAPVGSFSSVGYQDGAMHVFNTSVTFTWSESNLTAKLDGDDYTKRTSINTPGIYRLELSDRANNTTVYVFEIDFEKPVGELVGDYVYINGTYYFKEAFSFVWSENNCTATLDGNDYESGDLISDEATYVIILKDSVGNFTEIKAVLDKTAPTAVFSASYNSSTGLLYFNQNFYINWSESDVSALLNDSSYVKKTYVSEEKSYSLILSDLAGNTTTYSIVLDKTAPSALFSKVPVDNFGTLYFKEKVQLSWSESGCAATLNGDTIAYNSIIAIDDVYSLELVDKAGNKSTYSLVLDTVAPVGELVGVVNGGLSNSYVSFKWSENGCTATLNGASYKKGTNIYNPDTYSILLYDVAGNSTEYTFVIDFEVPVGELIGVENGGITNKEVFFTWDKEELTATLNGEAYSKGSVISAEGLHTIALTSEAGNTTTYTFEIDRTAPVGTLTGVENGGITKSSVIFKWSENGCTATLNGAAFDKNTYIDKDNKYTLILTDRAGNYTEYTFEIDKTAPVGTLGGVENGGITNGKVSLTWAEANCTATLNGEEYLNGTSVEAEGVYELKLYDAAGNSTVYTFEVDKTAPVGTLTGVENGGTTKGIVYFNWAEAGCTATLNGESYTRKTYLTADDIYTLVLTDRAGNSSEYSFIIDSEAPTGFLSGVENGGQTNTDVIFTWSESGCTATLNGEEYLNGTIITDEKSYTIILNDICGNTSVYTFTIDKTAPAGELVGVENGGITNGKVKLEFNSSYTALLNNTTYRSSSEVSEEGVYELILTDEAGNSTVYTFEIDRTAPVGSFSSSATVIGEKSYYSKNTYFTWEEEGCTATVNSSEYVFSSPLTEDNTYELKLYDAAGNVTVYTFIIDDTAPVGTLAGVENGGFTSSNVSVEWSEAGVSATLNGNTYKEGTSISEEKNHIIELKDEIGNSSIYSFTIDTTYPVFFAGEQAVTELVLKDGISLTLTPFDINLKSLTFNGNECEEIIAINSSDLEDGTYEAIAEDYAGNITKLSIIVNKTAPIITFADTYISNDNGNFFTKYTKFSWEEEGCTATLNGLSYKKNSTVYDDGNYVLELTDVAGNTTSFSFTILSKVSAAPLTYRLEDNTLQTVDIKPGSNYNSLTPLTVNIVSGSTVYINGEAISENTILSTPGFYTVKTVNAAGVEVEYTATILEEKVEDDGNSSNGADVALIIIGSVAGVVILFVIIKSLIKKKKLKIKRL